MKKNIQQICIRLEISHFSIFGLNDMFYKFLSPFINYYEYNNILHQVRT